ncbi:MAG: Fe-S cluster assembly transcriptional regulator IscR [Gammaproteobacteria bacterium]|nr:MAG: Fe-S cluster assembly transcriptional regulator IscR [Gammaproteobacteria bacterium]
MRLSRKGRFAVTAMMNLALHHKRGPMTLTELTHDQGISLSYLEQIFAKLRHQNLVSGVRGPGGGYCLTKAPEDISIAEVVSAIEESPPITNPEMLATLYSSRRSPIHAMWNELSHGLHDYLQGITLADCVRSYEEELHHQLESVAPDKAA